MPRIESSQSSISTNTGPHNKKIFESKSKQDEILMTEGFDEEAIEITLAGESAGLEYLFQESSIR